MNRDYKKNVLQVAKILYEFPFGLDLLKIDTLDRKVPTLADPIRTRILHTCLLQSGLYDQNGNILNSEEFQTFLQQVQGALWVYTDAKESALKIELVVTEPNWLSPSRIRYAEHVFRDLIRSARNDIWIVNPFFGIDTPQVMNLSTLIASRLQQGDIVIRLILRRASCGKKEFVLPILRRLCNLVPKHYLRQLKAHSLNLDEGTEHQTFHSKIIVQDDTAAYIGLANWTESSLQETVEIGVLIEGSFIQHQLFLLFQSLQVHATPIVLEMF